MGIEEVLGRVREAGATVWLDHTGKLRISSGAPDEIKELARSCKEELRVG